MVAASAARPGPGSSSRGVYDRPVRCRLAFWSGIRRRSRAAASAAPTRQEQVHEREPEPGAYHHVGPQHHVGPHDDVGPPAGHHVGPAGTTRRGDVRVSRNTRTVPHPARGRRRGRTRRHSASGERMPPAALGRFVPAARGVSRAANATPPARPAPGWPQPGVRGSRPGPAATNLLPVARVPADRGDPERRPGLRVLDGACGHAGGDPRPGLNRPADGPLPLDGPVGPIGPTGPAARERRPVTPSGHQAWWR